MKIGVNARRLAGQRLGIGRYLEYLFKYWREQLTPDEQALLFTHGPQTLPYPHNGSLSLRSLDARLPGSVWENVVLPRNAKGCDVFFGPSYTIPLPYRGRTVVATHSVNEVLPGTHPWWYRLTYTPWYRLSAQKADRVIVPASSTKADVQKYYGIPADKIDIVQEGVDDSFRPLEDEELNRATRIRFLGEDVPYILFVGKFSQRRNIPALMAAFGLLRKRVAIPHKLLLVGPNHLGLPLKQIAEDHGITDHVVQTDGRFDSHEELIKIYNAADLYVYPSTYDGFSLTTVEAMACGVPVIMVNRAALSEIGDDGAACLIEEPTPEILADAMERVLDDAGLRATLRAGGLKRSDGLRWRRTAQETLDVLRRVAIERAPEKRGT